MLNGRNGRESPVSSTYAGGRVKRVLTGVPGTREYLPSTRVWTAQKQSQSTRTRPYCIFEARRCASRLEAETVLQVMGQFEIMKYQRQELVEANLMAAYLLTGSAESLSAAGQYNLECLLSSKREEGAMSTIIRMYDAADEAATLFFGVTKRALFKKINKYREAKKSTNGSTFESIAPYPTGQDTRGNITFNFANLSTALNACAGQIANAHAPGSDLRTVAETDGRSPDTDGYSPDTLPTPRQSEACSPLPRPSADASANAQPPNASAVPAPSLGLWRRAAIHMAAPSPAALQPLQPTPSQTQHEHVPASLQQVAYDTVSLMPEDYVACHAVNSNGEYLGCSGAFQVKEVIGKGSYSYVFAAQFLGSYSVGYRTEPFFHNGSSNSAAADSIRHQLSVKLSAGACAALKVGLQYSDVGLAGQQLFTPETWRQRVEQTFVNEQSVYQRTAGSHLILTSFGLWLVELLSRGSGAPYQPSSISSWPLALMLEQGEQNLQQYLEAHGPLSATETFYTMRSAAQALMLLHCHGVIYRDLKPDNLQLITGPDGLKVIKAADFGLSFQMQHFGDLAKSAVGTPCVMAPECFGGCFYGVQADLFALGGLMLICRTGQAPFEYLLHLHPQERSDRLNNRAAELYSADCPYLSILTANELELVRGLITDNPTHRWHLEALFGVNPPTAYFMSGP